MSDGIVYIDAHPKPPPKWPDMPDLDAKYDCAICGEERSWAMWLAVGVAICARCRDAALAARDAEQSSTITTTAPSSTG